MINKKHNNQRMHIICHLLATYDEIVQKIGEPQVRCELVNNTIINWSFTVADRDISIYDWYDYRVKERMSLWFVQGYSDDVLNDISTIFPNNIITSRVNKNSHSNHKYLYK